MNRAIPSNIPNVLNIGPGKPVQAKAFNVKPDTILDIDKKKPFCFVI